MFSVPIIKSKLIMPQNSRFFLNSSRISKLSENILKTRVIEITAPLGYGKTSLAAAALSRCAADSRICWYRLDEQDVNLTLFYSHLIETLFPSNLPAYSQYRQKFDEFGDAEAQSTYINQLICNSLYEAPNSQNRATTYLVLDDYHTVAGSKDIQSAIRWLVDNLPNSFSIIITSRIESGLITEKQKFENDTLKIDYNALMFTESEINELSKKITEGKEIDAGYVRTITEGWAAGVLMVCRSRMKKLPESVNGLDSYNEAVKISNFNYMASELLSCLEPDLLDFLIKVSILDEFSEESVKSIFQLSNASEYIEQCESKGLFIQKLLGSTVTYRFHGLFREALQKMQENRLSSELVSKNYMLAAEYYGSKQNFSRAIEHYLAAGRTDMAAGMIANASRELISLEAIGKLRLLFNTLPRDVLEGNPGLMYMKSFLYQNGEEEAKRLLDKSLDIFERAGQTEMELNTLFSLLAFHLFKNNASQADCVLESAYKKASASGRSEFEILIPVFKLVKSVWDGETIKSEVLLRQSSFEEIPLNYLWAIYMYSCIHYVITGKLEMAESRIDSALQMEMVAHADILKGFCLLFQMIIAFYKNDIQVFDESLKQLHVISEKYNVLYMLAFSQIFKGLREYCLNNTDTACAMLQAGLRNFDQLGNYSLHAIFSLYHCLYQTVHGNKIEIYDTAQKSYQVLLETAPGFLFPELGEMLLGAVATETGKLECAEKLLLNAVRVSEEKNEMLLLCTSCMHLANLYYKTERNAELEEYLRKAFLTASSNQYYVFTGILKRTLLKLAAFAVSHHIFHDYACDLIAANFSSSQADFFRQSLEQDNLNSLVDRILSLCENDADQLPQTINVRFLGPFKLHIGGMAVPKSKYTTKKNESILKYLLFHKHKEISKEHLIELFWPDSDKKSGFASIRTALHGIRKIFSEYGISDVRGSFIVENNGWLRIGHPEYIDSDTELFMTLDNQQKSLERNEDKLPLLEKMISLYKGNLLEDGIYEEWAFFEREELKSAYFSAVSALASLYIQNENCKKAESLLIKSLSFDQYNEELSILLLKAYVLMNQPERARTFYANYSDILKRELDAEPGLKIKDIFKQILI